MAEKYSPQGAEIDISLTEDGGMRAVKVMDRGIGLTGDTIERLFDAFYRSDNATHVSPGIGIGLAVCRRLVEAQSGKIWARPRDGGGAEFGFSLAVCDASAG